MPDGTQKRESVGAFEGLNPYSITDAKDALSSGRFKVGENKIFDAVYNSNVTFIELSDWYIDLKSVQNMRSLKRMKFALKNFNSVFGNCLLSEVNSIALENYQYDLIEQGLSPSTIDITLGIAKTMVNKAFNADKIEIGNRKVKINGDILRAFNAIEHRLIKGANARKRIVTIEEYLKLLDAAAKHLKPMLIVAMNTGMRPGEIKTLKWSYIDKQAGFIRLPAEIIKEGKKTGAGKNIPISHNVQAVLDSQIRALHHEYVFSFGNKPITSEKRIAKSFKTACKKAGIVYGKKVDGGLIMHDFRRTVKTYMVDAGVNKVYRDTILGHSLKGMDMHYIKPPESSLKTAMEKYTAWLDAETEAKIQNVDHSVDQVANTSR